MRVLWPVWRRLARRGLRLAGRALAGVAVLVLAPVLALATLGGLAGLTATPAVLLGAALGVFASIFFLGLLLLLPRPASRLPRWLRALAILGVEALVVWQVAAATLAPLRDALPPPPVAGQRIWELSTGSRLAYVVRKPKRSRGLPPVVVLHGGPGRADLGGDSAFFGALAADGRPVYVYDQVGAGRSSRLADPGGYSLTRDLDDLEAIRLRLGADRLVLVGHAEGALLAAAYLARHPGNVDRLVLSSPAGLRPAPSGAALARLDAAQNRRLALSLLHPRVLAASALLQANPAAAHSVVGDAELDARLAAYHRLLLPARRCGSGAAPAAVTGAYANLVRRPIPSWIGEGISGSPAPTLIVKGSCDYQSWSSAAGYRAIMPASQLVYLRGAGHDAYRDRPGPYLEAVRAFLAGRPLSPHTGELPPPDFQGPP
ncbi:alpha/beta fold hydrolase [Nonomuraea dietziae]|uniref:Proline iminopeptidase n=1 Tax=Nonomuraea dietziae TaxID=65515 RepID=A0A7W5UVQ8_9ACTN|nr:alpha/beta hydrolase [Nonomuraea dietziae]MBB3725551.1 proline iminopeptidase [Nonomuraea dietziae]